MAAPLPAGLPGIDVVVCGIQNAPCPPFCVQQKQQEGPVPPIFPRMYPNVPLLVMTASLPCRVQVFTSNRPDDLIDGKAKEHHLVHFQISKSGHHVSSILDDPCIVMSKEAFPVLEHVYEQTAYCVYKDKLILKNFFSIHATCIVSDAAVQLTCVQIPQQCGGVRVYDRSRSLTVLRKRK
jgi:hypothetical protein